MIEAGRRTMTARRLVTGIVAGAFLIAAPAACGGGGSGIDKDKLISALEKQSTGAAKLTASQARCAVDVLVKYVKPDVLKKAQDDIKSVENLSDGQTLKDKGDASKASAEISKCVSAK